MDNDDDNDNDNDNDNAKVEADADYFILCYTIGCYTNIIVDIGGYLNLNFRFN